MKFTEVHITYLLRLRGIFINHLILLSNPYFSVANVPQTDDEPIIPAFIFAISFLRAIFTTSVLDSHLACNKTTIFLKGIPIMRTVLAATAFKMPLYGISFTLSAFSKSLAEASKQAFILLNKCLLPSEAKNLLLVWSEATDRHDWRSQALNKGLLLSDRSLFGRRFYFFSDFQSIDSLCLEKLYQSNFTAAKSSNGLSRLFCF